MPEQNTAIEPDLIITGVSWHDYAFAAALMLRRFPNAEIVGKSKSELPKFLNGLADFLSASKKDVRSKICKMDPFNKGDAFETLMAADKIDKPKEMKIFETVEKLDEYEVYHRIKNKKYKNIVILGIGLKIELKSDKNPNPYAFQKLKDQGINILWLSMEDACPFKDDKGTIDEEVINDFFGPQMYKLVNERSITDVVCNVYGISDAIIQSDKKEKAKVFSNLYFDDKEPTTYIQTRGENYSFYDLIEAAMFFNRAYQEEEHYINVIKLISKIESTQETPENPYTSTLSNTWDFTEILEHFKRYGNREVVGESEAMIKLRENINKAATAPDARVMILGATGTGKETVAQQIHNKCERLRKRCGKLAGELKNTKYENQLKAISKSKKKDGEDTPPFISFNCASTSPNLLDTRFLGNEAGAYTSATKQTAGLFEQADGGTLFLDEIGELPLGAQGVLLRVLQEGRFYRVGNDGKKNKEVEVNVRVITATNKDLPKMVCEGKFREDLFYRLNVLQIKVPSLKEHREDIATIANNFWRKKFYHNLPSDQSDFLKTCTYDFPGNVRELFNLLERASISGEQNFEKLLDEHKRILGPMACQESQNTSGSSNTKTKNPLDDLKGTIGGELDTLMHAINTPERDPNIQNGKITIGGELDTLMKVINDSEKDSSNKNEKKGPFYKFIDGISNKVICYVYDNITNKNIGSTAEKLGLAKNTLRKRCPEIYKPRAKNLPSDKKTS